MSEEELDKEFFYRNFLGAMFYIWTLCLGENDTSAFDLSEEPENRFLLYGFFVLTSWFFVVHMLNMLIAIMTKTYDTRSKDAQAI
jgi:hypothetical protein